MRDKLGGSPQVQSSRGSARRRATIRWQSNTAVVARATCRALLVRHIEHQTRRGPTERLAALELDGEVGLLGR